MSEVRPPSGQLLRSRRRAVRSGMSVCLALAVIYSFGYPGSAPLTSEAGATGKVLAQGAASLTDATEPVTGFVGEQQLEAPETASTFGTTDSLVPGRVVPGTEQSSRGRDTADTTESESLSTMERPGKGMLISPLQFLAPSSPFGMRTSPITGEHGEFHSGQDFAAPCGTRVFSADAGVVLAVGWHPWGGGNRVEVDHGNGLVTTYNHLEGIAVETGDRVGAGQVIATVGTTGWSTGCHLHFETILDGAHTDPSAWKLIPMDGSGPIEMPSLENFTPGTGNGNDRKTAWAAYLAKSEPIHPVAFKSPTRVDAEVSALAKRSTGRKSTTEKSSSSTSLASSTPSTSGTPGTTTSSPQQSTPGTSTKPSKPGTSTSTPPATGSTPSTPTPPPAVTTPTPTPPVDPTPTPPVIPTPPIDTTPPVVVDPTPTPPVLNPPPVVDTTPPVDPTPTPPAEVTPPVTVPDPTPSVPDPGPVTDPVPTSVPTASVTAPATACDTVPDPAVPENPAVTITVLVDPVTGKLVLDQLTGAPVPCELPTGSAASAATGTEPAREPGPALVTVP